MAQTKKPTSIRLSPATLELCTLLSAKLGVNRTAILEMAVHKLATTEGISTKAGDKVKAK